MPPRGARSRGSLAKLVETHSESDEDTLMMEDTSPHLASPRPVTTKRRGRPPASNKVTKPVPKKTTRQAAAAKPATRPARGRKPLEEKEVANTRKSATKAEEPEKEEEAEPEPEPTDTKESDKGKAKPARGRPRAAQAASAEEHDDAHTAGTTDLMEMQEEEETVPLENEVEPADFGGVGLDLSNDDALLNDEQFKSDMDLDQDQDTVSLRRRLGTLHKKHEQLGASYRELREVGIKEAERNYDRLKKQSDSNTAASNKLVAQLKADLTLALQRAQEGQEAQQELVESESRNSTLEDQVAALNKSLNDARNEIKTVSTKLAASRQAEAGMAVPGSALRGGSAASRAPSSGMVQVAQAKEDLYADLTGLLVRGVKLGDEEDIFDCIQTGRNGTLHFKLVLESASGSENYEDTQLTYLPQLDEGRDGELMDLLPDYLREEITFPRPQASKFYARVSKSLTDRVQ